MTPRQHDSDIGVNGLKTAMTQGCATSGVRLNLRAGAHPEASASVKKVYSCCLRGGCLLSGTACART
ncbi:hypothetical protein [Polaromonas sp. CG9_12]|nr:hypothetical protein [Polaromonas sp. CG9_12]